MIRKIIKLVILIVCVSTIYWKYNEYSHTISNSSINGEKRESVSEDTILIAHGGGVLTTSKGEQAIVTNAIEAFEQNYRQGFNFFEADFVLTNDDRVVARHDWGSYLYKDFLGQVDPKGDSLPLSYREVTQLPIHKKYKTANMKELIKILKKDKKNSLIIDIKYQNELELVNIWKKIVSEIKKIDKEVLSQIIPQIYDTNQFLELQSIHAFNKVILTLYKNRESNEVIERFSENHPQLYGITVPKELYSARKDLLEPLHERNQLFFINTVDSVQEAKSFIELGVDGFYTNVLIP